MQTQRLILPATIAATIGVGVWVHLLLTQATPDAPPEDGRPDYIVGNARITEISETGQPHRILKASTLRHYSARALTEVENPVLDLLPADAQHWRVHADSARITRSGDEILLIGTVEIDTLEPIEDEPMSIRTSDLVVRQDENYAETAQPALIRTPTHRIEGQGLRAWLDRPVRVKLLSHVRGRHEID